MKESYENLQELLEHSESARAYFDQLPQSVQKRAQDCGGTIHTQRSLRHLTSQWREEERS